MARVQTSDSRLVFVALGQVRCSSYKLRVVAAWDKIASTPRRGGGKRTALIERPGYNPTDPIFPRREAKYLVRTDSRCTLTTGSAAADPRLANVPRIELENASCSSNFA